MKKYFVILIMLIGAAVAGQAQFTHFGGRVGYGASYYTNDLISHSPILGNNLTAYVNYGFENAQSFWADNLYLQLAGGFTRRGSNIQQVFELEQSIRTAYYHNWYFQLNPLVCWRYELPVKIPNTYVNFYFGPEFSVGLFGIRWDRQVSPGYPQESINFDTRITGTRDDRAAFKHMRRLDGGLVMGVGYQYNNITIDLLWEHGFVPVLKEEDVLANLSIEQNGGSTDQRVVDADGNVTHITLDRRNGYMGTNQSFLICFGYQLPMK